MKNSLIKSSLPYIVAILSFYAITILFNLPEFSEGKTLRQTDVTSWKAMAKESLLHQQLEQTPAFWSNSMFGGGPNTFYALGAEDAPVDLLKFFIWGGFSSQGIAFQFFIAMTCCFIMLVCFKINPYLAALGSITFAFVTYNILNLEAGHHTKMMAISYSCLILGSLRLLFHGNRWLGFALACLGFALEVQAAHYQITFYLFFACLGFAVTEIFRAIKERAVPEFMLNAALVLIAAFLGLGTYAAQLFPTQQYTPFSTRGPAELKSYAEKVLVELKANPSPSPEQIKEIEMIEQELSNRKKQGEDGVGKGYAFSWSQGKMETFTMLIPNFYGGGSREDVGTDSEFYALLKKMGANEQQAAFYAANAGTYWGDQPFTGGPLYIGAIVCLLFLIGMFVLDNQTRWWLLAGVVITIMLSWGSNFPALNYFLYDNVPGFNKFRSVSMALSITSILMVLTSALTLQKFLKEGIEANVFKKKVLVPSAILGGICMLVVLFGGFGDFTSPAEEEAAAKVRKLETLGNLTASQKEEYQESKQTVLFMEALIQDRKSMARMDALRSLAFMAIALGLLWALAQKKMKALYAVLAIVFFAFIDLFLVDKRYLSTDKYDSPIENAMFKVTQASLQELQKQKVPNEILSAIRTLENQSFQETYGFHTAVEAAIGKEKLEKYKSEIYSACEVPVYQKSPADRLILLDKDPYYRVLNLATLENGKCMGVDPFTDASASFFHKSVGGYFAAKMQRYQELIDYKLNREVNLLRSLPDPSILDSVNMLPVLNMLNARYLKFGCNQNNVLRNKFALGNAWFVSTLVKAENAEKEMELLGSYSTADTAIVDVSKFPIEKVSYARDSSNYIKLTSYHPRELNYEYYAASESFVVFSDIYYAYGWKVALDNAELADSPDLIRVNYVLRGMKLPAGKHTLKMRFDPESYIKGATISKTFAYLVLFSFVLGVALEIYFLRKKGGANQAEKVKTPETVV